MAELPGDFVLVARRTEADGSLEQLLVTSVVGARPYFVLDAPGGPWHGEDVFQLVADAGIMWEWNLDALRGVAWLGHTIGDQALHPKVKRIPSDSILLYRGGAWLRETQTFWSTVFDGPKIGIEEAVDVFNAVTDELVTEAPLVSLSAGFDSRALLARMLASGRRPETITMGFPESTDMLVAKDITTAEHLHHFAVQLRPEQYLASGLRIAQLTGGTKTAGNWHTYLYPKDQNPGQIHLVGSNGEFARSFYLDRGALSHVARAGRMATGRAYWAARIGRRSRRLATFLPFLSPGGSKDAISYSQKVASLGAQGGGDGMQVLDRFYTAQRVRHFIGNGLALYAQHGRPVSPFLDARWIKAVGHLDRTAKLGSNYHRRIIERNAPQLLVYPVGGQRSMQAQARPGYWREKPNSVSYSAMPAVLRSTACMEILHESLHLDSFLSPPERQRLCDMGSSEAKEYMLTLHFAGEAVSQAAADSGYR